MPYDPYEFEDPYPMYGDLAVDPEEERRKWALEALDQPGQGGTAPPEDPMSLWKRMRRMGEVYTPAMGANAAGRQSMTQPQPLSGGGQANDPYAGFGRAVGNLTGLFGGG